MRINLTEKNCNKHQFDIYCVIVTLWEINPKVPIFSYLDEVGFSFTIIIQGFDYDNNNFKESFYNVHQFDTQ